MPHPPEPHQRRSIRLKGYDYTLPGAYFVTLVAYERKCLFGFMVNGEMHLNENGHLVQTCWDELPNHYPNLTLGSFVIMPNHVHAVIIIHPVGAGLKPAPTTTSAPSTSTPQHGLPEIVRAFKTFSARRINEINLSPGVPVWQRNYYEHIIRNDEEHQRIHLYIQSNPLNWLTDDENPEKIP